MDMQLPYYILITFIYNKLKVQLYLHLVILFKYTNILNYIITYTCITMYYL